MRLLWFLFFLPLMAATPHKYYVSTTDMYYKPEQQQLQLVVRVFTDDFSIALSQYIGDTVKLDPDNTSNERLKFLLKDYFKAHFLVKGLSEKTSFSFVGWEYDKDKTLIYALFEDVPKLDKLMWSNAFLMSAFPAQKNIVTLSLSTHKKSFLHTKDQNFGQYSF